MKSFLKQWLKQLSAPSITLWLLLLLIVLVVIGTLEQAQIGLYAAQQNYFHAWIAWFPSQSLVKIPFPGGATLFLALFLNLAASFFSRFAWNWKQAGLWICHIGIVLLVIGSALTFYLAQEGVLKLGPNEAKSQFFNSRFYELALTQQGIEYDRMIAFPQSMLMDKAKLPQNDLPFTLEIVGYWPSWIQQHAHPDFASYDPTKVHGDEPGCMVQIWANGSAIAHYGLVLDIPIAFTYQGEQYQLILQHKTYFIPFQVHLMAFERELYPGTDTPKAFTSKVMVQDTKTQREALIQMNRPLRYNGYTFYQSSFYETETGYGSVLAVVYNPAEEWPYFSCILIFAGMVLHFCVKLVGFIHKESRDKGEHHG